MTSMASMSEQLEIYKRNEDNKAKKLANRQSTAEGIDILTSQLSMTLKELDNVQMEKEQLLAQNKALQEQIEKKMTG